VNNTAYTEGNAISAKNIIDISGNWWGNNTPNGNKLVSTDAGDYTIPSYVILNLNVNSTSVNVGENVNVTVKYQTNTSTGEVSDFLGDLPSRDVILSSLLGSFNPADGNISNNFTSTFTVDKGGDGNITVTVDNQPLTINIKVVKVIPEIFYVNGSLPSSSAHDGESWATAFTNISDAVTTINTYGTNKNYTVYIAPGTYTENGMSINKNISFIGNDTNDKVIINGKEGQIFTTPSDDGVYNIGFNNLTLTNASVTNGNGSVICIGKNGNVRVTDCLIENNTATEYGGAINVV
jgi:predicted outer membrane repeat protein